MFSIRYAGEFQPKLNLITSTSADPLMLIAVSESSGEEILLFDADRHGYNAMFCDEIVSKTSRVRVAANDFLGRNSLFEVKIEVRYGKEFEDELSGDDLESGMVQLLSGEQVAIETARRNAFESISIFIRVDHEDWREIVSEELA